MGQSETLAGGAARRQWGALAAVGALLGLGACASTAPDASLGPPPPPQYGAFAPQPPPPPLAYAPAPPDYRLAARPLPPGLLAAPPADARPGECFARVRVQGEPLAVPPAQPHAVWVLTPPRPGQSGPMWCLYLEPGAPPPPIFGPERTGWIRVICDADATLGTLRHIQGRLRSWGYYHGPETGRFDAETSAAVRRFQADRRIEHGGYLSTATIDALDAPPPAYGVGYPPAAFPEPRGPIPDPYGAPTYAPGTLPPLGVYAGPGRGTYAPPPVRPCLAAVCPPPGYGATVDTGRPPYLSWPGKSLY